VLAIVLVKWDRWTAGTIKKWRNDLAEGRAKNHRKDIDKMKRTVS
jgi:predicted transcriptional regulator